MTSETLTIATLAALVRAGSLPVERLTPELQTKIDAFEKGELAENEGDDEEQTDA